MGLRAQVQYPDALQTMMADLGSIRKWAGFLQRTEIKFDMLSAVDELAKQAGAHCSKELPFSSIVGVLTRAAS